MNIAKIGQTAFGLLIVVFVLYVVGIFFGSDDAADSAALRASDPESYLQKLESVDEEIYLSELRELMPEKFDQ